MGRLPFSPRHLHSFAPEWGHQPAPAPEAVAEAMAALAERNGPVGRAIELVLGNLDRLAATLAAVAGLVAGRFVAGLAAAAVSVRGLATALALLRGALIRLPFVALVIGAQELILRFGRLVAGAGSFSAALDLLRGVERMLNAVLAAFPAWAVGDGGLRIGALEIISLGGFEAGFAGAARVAGGRAAEAFTQAFERDYRIPISASGPMPQTPARRTTRSEA